MTYNSMMLNHRRRTPRTMTVTELEHVVLIRDGVITRALGPGRHRLSRRRDRIEVLNAAPQTLHVPSQEILTADGVTVRATVAVVVTITDPVAALRAGDWYGQMYLAVQLALRAEVTGATLEALIADRSQFDEPLLAATRDTAIELGAEVSKLAVRDLVVPGEQRKLLAQIVEARLSGQAALERARGETAALRNLANAASMLRDNPDLYRIRLLQEIGATSGNTYVIDTEPA